MSDLREQVSRIIADEARYDCNADLVADAVLALFAERERNSHTQWISKEALPGLFAERERELRSRIEALPKWSGNAGKVLLDRADVLAEFDEAVSDGE